MSDSTTRTGASAVGAHNEWDPLEEVIVGHVEGAVIPMPHITVTRNVPRNAARFYRLVGGRRYPRILVDAARREVDHFVRLLEAEGVVVRRPAVVDNSVRCRTPFWTSKGYCLACPRDGFLVVGDEIIETPMAWRSRYFESAAYRPLFKEYFATGARWSAAPRPQLTDALFDYDYTPPKPGEPMRYVVNETEPVFDAADFVRCGTDLFGIRSNVTNAAGFEWLRQHLGSHYRVHEVESRCLQPMHIDTTFMPLAPGKLLINPEYIAVETLPAMFKSWDILIAPQPDPVPRSAWRYKISQCSAWISLNVLMLDETRVVVEEAQPSLIRALKDWGFSPIPCPFLSYAPFGGSFHCATLDVRRRGPLQSYF